MNLINELRECNKENKIEYITAYIAVATLQQKFTGFSLNVVLISPANLFKPFNLSNTSALIISVLFSIWL